MIDLTVIARPTQQNTITPQPFVPVESHIEEAEEETPQLPARTQEPQSVVVDGHEVKTGGTEVHTNPFLQEVDGSKPAGQVQVKAGEVDAAQAAFLKKTTFVE